jgi:hypothetical protein
MGMICAEITGRIANYPTLMYHSHISFALPSGLITDLARITSGLTAINPACKQRYGMFVSHRYPRWSLAYPHFPTMISLGEPWSWAGRPCAARL